MSYGKKTDINAWLNYVTTTERKYKVDSTRMRRKFFFLLTFITAGVLEHAAAENPLEADKISSAKLNAGVEGASFFTPNRPR